MRLQVHFKYSVSCTFWMVFLRFFSDVTILSCFASFLSFCLVNPGVDMSKGKTPSNLLSLFSRSNLRRPSGWILIHCQHTHTSLLITWNRHSSLGTYSTLLREQVFVEVKLIFLEQKQEFWEDFYELIVFSRNETLGQLYLPENPQST